MKNTIKFFGVITIVLVVSFSFSVCDNGSTDIPGTPNVPDVPIGPNITISGTPKIGQKLTATSNDGEFFGDFSWSFSEIPNSNTTYGMNNVIPSGVNNCEITIPVTLEYGSNTFGSLGKYIIVTRKYGFHGYSAIKEIGPITN